MQSIAKFVVVLTTLILLSVATPNVKAVEVIVGNGDSISRYAFGRDPGNASAQFPDFATGGSYQQVYAASAFSGPVTISQIAFASSPSVTTAPGTANYNFNIALSTTAAAPNGLSTTMAANRGPNPQQVFSGPITATLTANDQFDLVINITPFTYDPAAGNLLLEVTVNTTLEFSGGDRLYFSAGSNPSTSRVYDPAGTGAGLDDFGLRTRFTLATPTASTGTITGQITDERGRRVPGAVVFLSGAREAKDITSEKGSYFFEDLDAGAFYTVTPELANYHFQPKSRSFSLVGNQVEAVFTALPDSTPMINVIDSNEYFVRQQYLDFLNREPDQQGLLYWSARLAHCGDDPVCLHQQRIDVSAAFFKSLEFQKTGSYIYRLYEGALGRRLTYGEFAADRTRVVGGDNLDANKLAFAGEFAIRPEFVAKYQAYISGESFVDALLQTLRDTTTVDLSAKRAELIQVYNSGRTLSDSRGRVLAEVAENGTFAFASFNRAFVQMEYFGYLQRDGDQDGYSFWLNVVNDSDAGNYLGMVCSFITSAEYQARFGTVMTRSNAECAR